MIHVFKWVIEQSNPRHGIEDERYSKSICSNVSRILLSGILCEHQLFWNVNYKNDGVIQISMLIFRTFLLTNGEYKERQ